MKPYLDKNKAARQKKWRLGHQGPPLPKTRAKLVRYLADLSVEDRARVLRALVDEVRLLDEVLPNA